jgi:AraC-like DNA-binding protein
MKRSQGIQYLFTESKIGSFFHFTENLFSDEKIAFSNLYANHILWNRSSQKIDFFCDDKIVTLRPNSFCTFTPLNFIKFISSDIPLTAISFNREFYCLRDHDHEISCNGILFYGAQNFSTHLLSHMEVSALNKILDLFIDEFSVKDPVHEEMLVSLLKIVIIHLTRIGKNRIKAIGGDIKEIELIRKFYLLVDGNFKEKKQVHDYAFLLNISPKKLSETFKLAKLDPPLQTIHNRITLEAKRLLVFSQKSIVEISDELGFEDPSQFSKLFKKVTLKSPSQFKSDQSQVIPNEMDSPINTIYENG